MMGREYCRLPLPMLDLAAPCEAILSKAGPRLPSANEQNHQEIL
jgi:hypothetical protein